MAEILPINLGPWSGIDNVHDPDAAVFQAAGENEKRRPAVLTATDVDIDNDGRFVRRGGVEAGTALSAGLSVFSGAGLLLVQDGGDIKTVDPADWSASILVTGLNPERRVVFHEHAAQVFWTNKEVCGRIVPQDGVAPYRVVSSVARNWGCTAPEITAEPLGGLRASSIQAGRYLITATFVDSSGIEHGAGKSQVAELATDQGLWITLPITDPAAVSVRIYISRPNNTGLFFATEAAPADFPFVLTDFEVSEEPLRTQFLVPPLPADVLFSYRGMLVLGVDEYLFPSYGVNAHLYEVSEVLETRPEPVLAGAGLDDGFWTVTANGAFWTTGTAPETWQTWRRNDLSFAAGSLVLDGGLIPKLETNKEVALFVSEHGLVAGLPGGVLVQLQQDRVHLDVTAARASIAYREVDKNLRQLVFNLVTE